MDKVIILKDWYLALENQPKELRAEVMDAVLAYGLTGKEPENLTQFAAGMFLLIKTQMDKMQDYYKEQHNSKSEAGKKGMNKRWKNSNTDNTGADQSGTTEKTPTKSDKNITEITDDNKNNGVINDITPITNVTPDNNNIILNKINNTIVSTSVDTLTCEKNDDFDYNFVIYAWNNFAPNLPPVTKLTPKMRACVKRRANELGKNYLQTFRRAFELCNNTPFLSGGGPQGWRATFDWLFKNSENIQKVLNGNYDGKNTNNNQQSSMFTDNEAGQIVAAAAAFKI